VQATDNETYSRTAELTVFIDAMNVDDIGYFTDDDNDDIFDTFHGNLTTTDLGQDTEGNYLIDVDGDGAWDYLYDMTTNELTEYTPEPTGEEYTTVIIIAVIAVILVIGLVYFFSTKKK
jgi:hypothetical protein